MTRRVPAGDPTRRHSGPAFGYVLEGEMLLELDVEPERVVRAGERSPHRSQI